LFLPRQQQVDNLLFLRLLFTFLFHSMLQKSDGGYGYDSTDMAALKFRIQELGADRIIVITDFTQADHFKMCFKAAEMVGWISPSSRKIRLDHIGFGTVQGEDGKRFKTRSGDTVRLVDLLDEAVIRMETQLRERISSGSANIAEEEVHKTACILGYGAVKYFDLRRNPTSNYIFSYDRMLDTKVSISRIDFGFAHVFAYQFGLLYRFLFILIVNHLGM
jgi:arginyl-tRNA synthetase